MLTELDIYLGEYKWAAADYVTLADFAILTMIASCKVNIFDSLLEILTLNIPFFYLALRIRSNLISKYHKMV